MNLINNVYVAFNGRLIRSNIKPALKTRGDVCESKLVYMIKNLSFVSLLTGHIMTWVFWLMIRNTLTMHCTAVI